MKWSYSGLKQMVNCPRQFHEVKVLRNYVQQDTEQTLYGKEVHTALELYIRDGVMLPKNYRMYKPAVDTLAAINGDKYTELKMGLKADRVTPCDFDDPDYWVHGIADLVIIEGKTGYVVDYKTGNARYADTKQLKLMALMLYAKFPKIDVVKGGLLFLSQNIFVPSDNERKDIPALWEEFETPLARMTTYMQTEQWPANPTGLCKRHCPVDSCQYNGRNRL